MKKNGWYCPNGCTPEYWFTYASYVQKIKVTSEGEYIEDVGPLESDEIDENAWCPLCKSEASYHFELKILDDWKGNPSTELPYNSPFDVIEPPENHVPTWTKEALYHFVMGK